MKILLDINVLLDVFQARVPYYETSAQVLSLCTDSIRGYISAISFGTLNYILAKGLGRQQALIHLKKIRAFTKVAPVDAQVIDLAINSHFSDLEDAIQYYCSLRSKLTHIITRNKKDYKKAKIVVATPDEFLKMLEPATKENSEK